MTTHSKLSPSGRARWSACPGSIRMSEGIPNKSGKAAIDGTKTHFVLEQALLEGKDPVTGMSYDVPEIGRFHLEEDRRERVQFTLDYVKQRVEELGGASKVTVSAETYLDNSQIFGRDDLNGTADIIIESDTVLEVVDLKDGMTPVEAVGNKQAELYALGALFSAADSIKDVRITIIQPKMRFQGQTGISVWDVTAEYVGSLVNVISAEADACDDPEAPCVPGEVQCKWCLAKGGCTAVHNKVTEAIGVNFQAVDIPKEVATINPEVVSNEKLSDMMQAVPLLRQLIDVVEIEALRRFETGNPVQGLKVVGGRGSKTWAKTDEEVLNKLTRLKIPKDKRTSSKPITATQALKIKWTNSKGEELALTERQIKTLSEDYISFNEGKLKVVSENAPGKAIELMPPDAFKPVNPEPEVKPELEVKPEIEIPDWMKM